MGYARVMICVSVLGHAQLLNSFKATENWYKDIFVILFNGQ
jgi:hypothetical protein